MAKKEKKNPDSVESRDNEPEPLKKKYFEVSFYHDWCKACGICMAFCPKQIIKKDKAGKPFIDEPDKCIGCRFCETHCPDFAISVSRRSPKRRKTDV